MLVSALQPSLSPHSVTRRRTTVANDTELAHRRTSGATIERAPIADDHVDVQILKKLSASVSHFEGPRKNLSFVVSVETLIPGRRAFSDERESCQLVARSFDDFRHFRKSLLARVGSLHDPVLLLSGRNGKCRCDGVKGCPFDVTRSFLERLKFTRMPFLSLGESEADLIKRQQEMDSFLHIIFAILHRMQPGSWHSECRFLQDVMAFLEVEESFSRQMELMLRCKNRRMNLDGWKAHTLETFGSGIGV
uniref:PX domain-containing protein n=1 Tax=Peronospora matthiolae TaxID=2874970 RepID=A0AAV1UTP6_9STRA